VITVSKIALTLFILAAMACGAAQATEEYAEQTDQDCEVCHHDPSGGGALTPVGEAFVVGQYRWPIPPEARATPPLLWKKALRFAVGLVHFLTAIVWFGTIFYVHIVLRPTYAKGGLPRKEILIAWAAVAVLAVTGTTLTLTKVPHLGALATTRWGLLLLLKIGLFLTLVLSAAYVTLFLSPKLRRLRADWQKNDGVAGRPAWVKVENQLYDLSESPRWKNGNHFNRHRAGQDLTKSLAGAPHGAEKLEGFSPFSLTGGKLQQESTEVKVLYVMAYLNLAVAIGIIVVMSLWRWG
jgi:predicted heme/steroid binding protein